MFELKVGVDRFKDPRDESNQMENQMENHFIPSPANLNPLADPFPVKMEPEKNDCVISDPKKILAVWTRYTDCRPVFSDESYRCSFS